MSSPSFWSRVRTGRLVQVLLVYLGASWLVVQVVGDLRDMLELPHWIGPVTLILLVIGLIIILATAWVQSHPLVDAREAADEVPHSWELDLGEAVAAVRRGRLPHLTWSRALVAGAVAFGTLIVLAAAAVLVRSNGQVFRTSEVSASDAPDGIAVLPFTVRGAELEDWREGMVDLLSTGLDGAAGLRAIASRTVLARWHESVPAGVEVDQQTSLDVAREVGARWALIGSAIAIGPRVRLSVDVHELDGAVTRSLGQAQVEGHPDSVLVLVDRLGMQTLALVLRQVGPDLPQIDLASVTTESLPALKSYLEGESLFRRGDFEGAAAAHGRAVAIDSLFALAYWRQSQALGWNETVRSVRAAEANERALELVDRLPPRDALLARATMHIRKGEIESVPLLQEAVRKYPDDAEAWYQLGDAYYHLPGTLVDWTEIEQAFEKAVALAPRVPSYRIHLIDGAFRHHADSALVRAHLAELERLAPNSPLTVRLRAAERSIFGGAAARDSVAQAILSNPGAPLGQAVHTAMGHPRFVERRRELGRAAYPHIPPPARAQIARGIGWGYIYGRGQVADGLDAFRDPALGPSEWTEAVIAAHLTDIPVPAEDLVLAEADLEPDGDGALMAGAIAARRQHWDVHAAAVAHLREQADSLLAAGDTTAARQPRSEVMLLEGYALVQRGRVDEGILRIEASRVPMRNEFADWWLGRLHFDAGRWREAEPYFRSFMKYEPDPLAAYYLGRIHEATGRSDEARRMFGFFVEHWASADPSLQPLVSDARQRLTGLVADRD